MALTDEQYVNQVMASITHWRARNAAFMDAASRIRVDPVHELVWARFDSDGTLQDMQIDPAALSEYTNIELEDILTDVLRRTRASVHAQVMGLFEKYLAPTAPGFDPNAVGEPFVDVPD